MAKFVLDRQTDRQASRSDLFLFVSAIWNNSVSASTYCDTSTPVWCWIIQPLLSTWCFCMLRGNSCFPSIVFPHEVPHRSGASVEASSAPHLLTDRWNARWSTWSLKGSLIKAQGPVGSVTSLHITCQTTRFLPASMSSLSIIKPPTAQCLPSELFDKWPLPSVHGTITVFASCSTALYTAPRSNQNQHWHDWNESRADTQHSRTKTIVQPKKLWPLCSLKWNIMAN